MESISLYQLNNGIKSVLGKNIPAGLWIRAEIHNLTVNNGHCYLDLIEKETTGDRIIARQRATIWAGIYERLNDKFHKATGKQLQAGTEILIQANVEFHELYGINLNVRDIDPDYTLGALQRRRNEIIESLKKRGLIDKNRTLPLPLLPKKIAVISSITAAGYSDFVHQLTHNNRGFAYSVTLFKAIMQGTQTEESVVKALCDIYRSDIKFDLVVIIRGGGAGSDLLAFDSERIAEACARFPLPIISGIGHLRDKTILDMVAHTAVKTPTAAAEFIVAITAKTADFIEELQIRMTTAALKQIETNGNKLKDMTSRLPYAVSKAVNNGRLYLNGIGNRIPGLAKRLLSDNELKLERYGTGLKHMTLGTVNRESLKLTALETRLNNSAIQTISAQRTGLELLETKLALLDPKKILQQGYSITLCNGKPVTKAAVLKNGDTLTSIFADGEIQSKVTEN